MIVFGTAVRHNAGMTDDEVINMLAGLGYDPAEIHNVESGYGVKDVLAFGLYLEQDWQAQWQTLRDLVPTTGRWPVAFAQFPCEEVDLGLFLDLRKEFSDKARSAAQACDMAEDFDTDAYFADYEPGWHLVNPERPLDAMFEALQIDSNIKDLWRAEADERFTSSKPLRDVEHWLVHKQVHEDCHSLELEQSWPEDFVAPEPDGVALLPSTGPVDGLSYVATYACDPVRNTATARRWASHHGVELVAATSCSYLFQMPEPVSDVDAAWRLAIELLAIRDCSAGGAAFSITPLHLAPALTKVRRFDGTSFP